MSAADPSVANIGAESPNAGTVIFDLDGVVYVGDTAVPGAGDALRTLEDMGCRLLFATNNASRTPDAGADKIANLTGYPAVAGQVVTSALAAATALPPGAPKCLVVGGEGLRVAVTARGGVLVDDWSEAEIVLTGYNRDLTYELLRDAALAIRNGAAFIASNDDPTFPAPDGLWPGSGATVAFLERATDVAPVIAGKPHAPMRLLLTEMIGPGPVWMVGDRPDTDLAMARAEGWTGVLVLTGVTPDGAQIADEHRPDVTVDSIGEVVQLILQE